MNKVEPSDTAMDVLAMAWQAVAGWLIRRKMFLSRPSWREIERVQYLLRRCSNLLAAEIESADKAKSELAALRKELSNRGIDIEVRGGSWHWRPE